MTDKEIEMLRILYGLGQVIEDRTDWATAGLMCERLLDQIAPRIATSVDTPSRH